MMGFPSRADVLGKSLNEAFSDEQLPRWQSIDDFVNSEYHITNTEMVRDLPNGDCRILLSSTIGVIEDDQLRRIWGTSTDITERRQAQLEAEQQRIQLIEADKMISLGTLVSGVAHEVNNPNQYILLNIKTLQSAWQDMQPVLDTYAQDDETYRIAAVPYSEMKAEIPKTMEEIQEGADRIKLIVSELRNYSRRQDPQEFTSVDVNDVVKAALTLIADPIKKATDRFSVVHAQHVPKIHGNLRRLEQVVINLVLNACQATDDKSKAVTVETRFDSITRHALIEVRDEGSGISKEDLAHIQDPFFTTKRDSGGTGLGLAVSSRIVEEHQGQLTFESDIGKGTTARLSLPTEGIENRS
jgi:polar amino acid transport system substrate-binding protein